MQEKRYKVIAWKSIKKSIYLDSRNKKVAVNSSQNTRKLKLKYNIFNLNYWSNFGHLQAFQKCMTLNLHPTFRNNFM